MNRVFEFEAEIIGTEDVNGAYVEFPYDVKEAFGHSGIIKVEATFDGYRYRGALVKMGPGRHIIGIRKAIRAAIGKEPGDRVEVTIQRDDKSRLEEIPDCLIKGLDTNPVANAFFKTLTDSQRNKFIRHIASAKKPETVQKRLEKALTMLENHEKMK